MEFADLLLPAALGRAAATLGLPGLYWSRDYVVKTRARRSRTASCLSARLLLHAVVALGMEAPARRDEAPIEGGDGQPAGHAHDVGDVPLPVRLRRHELSPIPADTSLGLPDLDAEPMTLELAVVVELGDALHSGDRRATAVARSDRAQIQREPRFRALRQLARRHPLPDDRTVVAHLV